MAKIKQLVPAPFLGAKLPNPKVLGSKVEEIIEQVNRISNVGGDIVTNGIVNSGNTTTSGQLTGSAGILQKHTGVAINTTGAGTLAVVTSGVLAGLITSTSAAGVTVTLDSVANMITAFTAAGKVAPAAGSWYDFAIDNSAGANTVTLAVDAGATIAVVTPAITGGATLTVSTANVIGTFRLYFKSTTAAKLFRLA
jgi:hypothetical protein